MMMKYMTHMNGHLLAIVVTLVASRAEAQAQQVFFNPKMDMQPMQSAPHPKAQKTQVPLLEVGPFQHPKETTSSGSSCDSWALLQTWSAAAATHSDQGPNCLQDDLDSGSCLGPDTCKLCDTNASNFQIPSTTQRFPKSMLLCDSLGMGSTCTQTESALPLEFKESDQVMVCKGPYTCGLGPQQPPFMWWRVKNVSAVCCSSAATEGGACRFSEIQLASSTLSA